MPCTIQYEPNFQHNKSYGAETVSFLYSLLEVVGMFCPFQFQCFVKGRASRVILNLLTSREVKD